MARGGRGAPQSWRAGPDARWFSGAILVTCVMVTGLGLVMGLYLDNPPEAAPAPAKCAEEARLVPPPVAAVDVSAAWDAVATSANPSLVPALEEHVAPPVQSPPGETNPAAAESGATMRLPPP